VRVERLFVPDAGYRLNDQTHAMYAVMADGRFLMTRPRSAADTGSARARLVLVEHWMSEIGPLLQH